MNLCSKYYLINSNIIYVYVVITYKLEQLMAIHK